MHREENTLKNNDNCESTDSYEQKEILPGRPVWLADSRPAGESYMESGTYLRGTEICPFLNNRNYTEEILREVFSCIYA